ncbi:hypothetical protein CERSUDRAFT_117796 [Gelatoporia subvermispora B]|uniref:CRAL-TRIO domain-containing protein n=1 Tax=Ceriporiopsis subvermispora (strain B) TaxID=914234 RepID=M2Q9Z2_CERS8|nr:hypothetical protein CERSUDRAFT_117796 [Gelatoporia subvermispora B]
MSIHDSLREYKDQLDKLYEEHLETVRALQDTLIHDILPDVVNELSLGQRSETRAREWLEDTDSLFRILKRDKFIVSFALESARRSLIWRLNTLPECAHYTPCPVLKCLPSDVRDPFGRPIVYMEVRAFGDNSEGLRQSVANTMELLRVHLKTLNDSNDCPSRAVTQPILQYVALLDIQGVTFQCAQHVDFVSWFVYDLLPRFPGMLAATFILNYTWAHSGLWSLAKRALPASALSKVFFLTSEELRALFAPSSLPSEFGGALPALAQLGDPLRAYVPVEDLAAEQEPRPASPAAATAGAPSAPTSSSANAHARSAATISPTSSSNPFYGYPVSVRSSTPTLRHGRRRKRDLLWTLARLWWARWGAGVRAGLVLVLAVLVVLCARSARARRWRPAWLLMRLAWPPSRALERGP